MELAKTLWPRTGGDERNSACIPVPGPQHGRIVWSLPLPRLDRSYSGVIQAADGHLRVVHQGTLSGVTVGGRKLWTRSLKLRRRSLGACSLPLALDDGRVLVSANRRLAEEIGGRMRVVAKIWGDDSGPSPNLDARGVYLGGIASMLRWNGTTAEELGPDTGYDILPPALFANGDFAMTCYYGEGLCRVTPAGATVWSVHPRELDTLVVINGHDEVTCSSLNDRCSVVVDGDGSELWRLPFRAHFSCCPDDGWVALSSGRLTRLDRAGHTLWTRSDSVEPDWGLQQAVVDSRGWVYAPCRTGLTAFDEEGRPVFRTSLPEGSPSGLCPVAPGQMALVHEGHLILVE